MKILFITPFNIFPPYWGGGQRTYHLIKHLSKNNEVYLVFPSYSQFQNTEPERYYKELKDLNVRIYPIGNWLKWQIIEFLNPFFIFKSLYLLLSKKIDLIICDYPWSGAYTLLAHALTFKPYIFIEHNIEHKVKEQTKSRYVKLLKWLEIILCKVAKRIIVVSRKNQNELVRLGVNRGKILIFENGFDSERFYPDKKFNEMIRKKLNIKNKPIIFFCGKFDYAPNLEALYTIRWKILPKVLERIPDSKFVIAGGGRNSIDSELNHPSLIFTGLVNNIERYLNAADVVIVPITKGSGTRIKILEAIACGKTVVSTSKGAESLVNELTKPLLKIAGGWDDFSNQVIESIKNPKNEKVPVGFIKKYSWESINREIDKVLEMD